MATSTMKAVIFHGQFKVALEDRPIPKITDPRDIIVKVTYAALCGSELHVYRGHEPSGTGFILGHEFTGHVEEVGSSVTSFKKGDLVVSPFTTSCGECFFCSRNLSARCSVGRPFGSSILDGGQAEYVRVPLADTTAVKAPKGINEEALVLMADIFPTGYFAAANAFRSLRTEEVRDATVVLLGCGPVGLCALLNILDNKPKHVLAVDSIDSRLDLAASLGAEPHNFQTGGKELEDRVKELTQGRGADIVIEVVGQSSALQLGFNLLRPGGMISSVGVHNAGIPWTGAQAYDKNLRIQMGRCPVRSIFPQALEKLREYQEKLDWMLKDIRTLGECVAAYEDFNAGKTQKVVFRLN